MACLMGERSEPGVPSGAAMRRNPHLCGPDPQKGSPEVTNPPPTDHSFAAAHAAARRRRRALAVLTVCVSERPGVSRCALASRRRRRRCGATLKQTLIPPAAILIFVAFATLPTARAPGRGPGGAHHRLGGVVK